MSEIAFGTPEHIAGLSREALEADFRYVQDRRTELEEACEQLQAENSELRELVRISIEFCADGMCGIYEGCPLNAADGRCRFDDRARELGVEVDA